MRHYRKCYTDYVRHALRYYSRFCADHLPDTMGEIETANYTACAEAIKAFSERERAMFLFIYRSRADFELAVRQATYQWDIAPNVLWDNIKSLEQSVAKYRGLI